MIQDEELEMRQDPPRTTSLAEEEIREKKSLVWHREKQGNGYVLACDRVEGGYCPGNF